MSQEPMDVVRLATPQDLVCAASQLLGFVPSDSVVALCCDGPAHRLGLAIRFDLSADAPGALAAMIDERVRCAGADGLFVVVFGDEPPDEDEARLPFGELAARLRSGSGDLLIEMLYVAGDRCWSYLCDGPGCCPAGGAVVDRSSSSATALAAAYALAGQRVLPSRDALVESMAFAGDVAAAAAMRALVSNAERRLSGEPQQARRAAVRKLLQRLSADGDPRHRLDDVDVAELTALCGDVVVRDEVLVSALEPCRRTELRRMLTDVARRVPEPVDVAICATLAFVGYADGDGVTANVLLDRALGSDPHYSLGLLIADALQRQLPPHLFEEVMRGAARDLKKAAPTR